MCLRHRVCRWPGLQRSRFLRGIEREMIQSQQGNYSRRDIEPANWSQNQRNILENLVYMFQHRFQNMY